MAGEVSKKLRLLFTTEGTKDTLQQMELMKMSISEFSAPINAAVSKIRELGGQFETSMANVSTLLGDSKKQVDDYGNSILKLSTEVPDNAQQLSDGLYQAISAGIDTSKAMDFVAASSKAAAAGMTSSFVAIDGGTSILNAMNMSAEQSGQVFDMMFQTVRDGKINFEQLSSQIGMLAPAASAAHVPLAQMMAAISTTTSKIKPEQAITGIAAAIRELDTPASKAEKALNKMGYATLQDALKSKSLQEILIDLVNSGEKITGVFGAEAARAVAAVGGSAEQSRKHLDNMLKSTGTTETAYAKMADTLENKQKILKNSQEALAIQLAEQMEPATKAWIDTQIVLIGLLNDTPAAVKQTGASLITIGSGMMKATEKAIGLASGVKGLIDLNGMFAKSFGGVIKMLSQLELNFKKTSKSSDQLSKSMKTTAAVAAGVAVAGTAAAAIYDYLAEKQDKLNKQNDAEAKSGKEAYQRQLRNIEALRSLIAQGKNIEKFGGDAVRSFRNIAMITDDVIVTTQVLDNEYARVQNRLFALNRQEEENLATQEAANKAAESRQAYLQRLIRTLKNYGVEFGDVSDDVEKDIIKAQEMIGSTRLQMEQDNIEKTSEIREEARLKEYQAQLEANKENIGLLRELMTDENNLQYDRKESDINFEKSRLDTIFELNEGFTESEKIQYARLNEALNDLGKQRVVDQQTINSQLDEMQLAQNEKQKQEQDRQHKEQQDKIKSQIELYRPLWESFADLPATAIKDGVPGLHDALKSMLVEYLSAEERKMQIAEIAVIADGIITGGITLASGLAKLVGLTAAFETAKAAIASFDIGGIPQVAGMAMVHPSDVIINPTSNNAMMEMLTDRLAAKINGGNQQIALNVDGRVMAEVTVPHINNMNRTLPKGRDVFDRGRWA